MTIAVVDLAEYILEKKGIMTTMQLHKLIYFIQAWHLVFEGCQLFDEEIHAWGKGPVVPFLYSLHKDRISLSCGFLNGNSNNIPNDSMFAIEYAIDSFEANDEREKNFTNIRDPWEKARIGLSEKDRGHSIITNQSMYEYYKSILKFKKELMQSLEYFHYE